MEPLMYFQDFSVLLNAPYQVFSLVMFCVSCFMLGVMVNSKGVLRSHHFPPFSWLLQESRLQLACFYYYVLILLTPNLSVYLWTSTHIVIVALQIYKYPYLSQRVKLLILFSSCTVLLLYTQKITQNVCTYIDYHSPQIFFLAVI